MISTLIFLAVISILVFVHELGHFLAARLFDVGVRSFAIGFVPTLWSKRVGQTVYKINAIPMGGYVALLGEDEEGDAELSDRGFKKSQYLQSKPWWQKIIVMIAGIVFNFIFALVVLVILSLVSNGWSGFASGFQLYMHLMGEIVFGIFHFLGGIFSGGGLGDVSGPVGIARILGDAAHIGFSQVAFLTAILSINLGLMNLIPFPALDGGQIVVVLIEKIIGKPLTPQVQGVINMIGFGALILLMVVVTFKDVVKLF
jgi:regulator of sigma E protease